MSTPRPPVLGTRSGIAVAVRALPSADRERYYCEFVAELYGLPASAQFRHTAGVLSQAFALRAALGGSHHPSEEVAMQSTTTAGQRFRCRYLHWHHWTTHTTPDGERFVACAVCNKDHGGWDTTSRNIVPGG